MFIIYREATGEVVENSGTNSLFPQGVPDELAWGGRDRTGLALLRLHDEDDAELVRATFTHRVTVTDGQLVVGEPLPAPDTTPDAGGTDVLSLAADLARVRQVLDLLLVGGIDDSGETVDDVIGVDLPDDGGSLADLDGWDFSDLPDSGETLDDLDLASMEG